MGCCASSTATRKSPAASSPPATRRCSKSPPTPEEEAVKEVLSETPIVNHHKLHCPSPAAAYPIPAAADEISEVSCLSETPSALDADAEIQRRIARSPSPGRLRKESSLYSDPAVRRERMTGKSPVRRSGPSPPRRAGPDPRMGQVVVRSRVGGGFGSGRREHGENSSRRSRSPVTRNDALGNKANVGRSPSARRTGLSPGRVRMVQAGEGYGDGGGRKREEENDNNWDWERNPTAASESLENPLVSLECFIFL